MTSFGSGVLGILKWIFWGV